MKRTEEQIKPLRETANEYNNLAYQLLPITGMLH